MNYFDKNGNQIKAGMDIRMADGSIEQVYETTDAYGNPDLGINASNEEYRERHPYLRPELFTDVESDDDDDDEDEAPPMCVAYDEPLVERDFEG